MEGGGEMLEPSLCMEDLMELKCSAIIGDSIQLIPFENTFTEEQDIKKDKVVPLANNDKVFTKMRRSLVGDPLRTEDGRFACPHCDKTFSQKYIVPRHIR